MIMLEHKLTVVDIANPTMLRNYYRLLLAVMRVVTSTTLSHGPENTQMLERVRMFLAENRFCMVAIFKRHAKIGGTMSADFMEELEELVGAFTVLITMSNYLEVRSICIRSDVTSLICLAV